MSSESSVAEEIARPVDQSTTSAESPTSPEATASAESPAEATAWWHDAVVYQVYVRSFADGNGDGCGDFRGLIQNIDHLARLGVTCLWLMPFFPSPDRDDGYDITDFYGVDPRLGTPGDVVELDGGVLGSHRNRIVDPARSAAPAAAS